MLDFIFVTGTSGVGKSTLSRRLYEHYRSVYIEEWMVPEFISLDGGEDVNGELEERTCYENVRAMALCFHGLGYKNVVISDIDDLRTREIPIDFRGHRFLTIRLVCTDPAQIHRQMENRPNNGLIDYELQEKLNAKNLARAELVNEHTIDIAGLDADAVFARAVEIIDNTEPLTEYEYTRPPKELFYSWVFANGLR